MVSMPRAILTYYEWIATTLYHMDHMKVKNDHVLATGPSFWDRGSIIFGRGHIFGTLVVGSC